MVEKEILFIFGAPRSGTTYLNALVREYFDYGLCAEGDFVVKLAKLRNHYGDLSRSKNLHRLVEDICQDRMLQHFRVYYSKHVGRQVDVQSADILRTLPEPTMAGVIYSVFFNVAQQLGSSRVGNKNPGYYQCLPQLLEWFPNAKFLYIVRDGRDVALSTMKEPWGEKSAIACARKWIAVSDAVTAFERQVGAERFKKLHYESLLSDPDTVMGLERFLGAPLEPGRKAELLREIKENELQSNFHKWKRSMTGADLRRYEAVAGHVLRGHGYELGVSDPRASVFERMWYMGKEYGRRLRRRLWREPEDGQGE